MNNGKVRIYELSKELNLENKDILDICEQLNIAVKSHSSTITESQAERIRSMAERYTPSHAPAKAQGGGDGGGGGTISKSPQRPKEPHKQQILAIHHKQPQTRPANLPQSSGQAVPPTLVAPSRLPVKPQSSVPFTPSSMNRSPATESSSDSSDISPKKAIETDLPEMKPEKTERRVAIAQRAEKSQLVAPPPRGKAEGAGGSGLSSRPKPVKKGDPAVGSLTSTPTLNKGTDDAEKRTRPVGGKKSLEPSKFSPKLQQPPQRPKSPQDLLAPDDLLDEELEADLMPEDLEEETLLEPPKRPQTKAKRPAPPRLAKRKVWEEEEEETEGKGKVAKGTTKNKRRSQLLLDEDDEDLDAELDNNPLPLAVSLSIARPPKPKSQEQPNVAPAATTKFKKPTLKGEGGSTRSKSERRDKKVVAERPESVVLSGSFTVRDLSEILVIPETEIIKHLFFKGIPVNITQTLDLDTARLVAEELGVKVETAEEIAAATKSTEMLDEHDLGNLQRRPPVVTIMGHVDHGKTTLLDSIRQTKVAQGEAGGITQHIGAYHVDVEHEGKSQQIVFLDTPGHEAFTAMRARGTRVTDIAILVVAADDGVQPQTREAISHAKAAGVPIVVAINKVDKVGSEPDRVKQELTEHGLVPEEWGGDTIMVPVSALKGENLDNLLEMIILVAELEELSANPDRRAKGTVIEANLDRTRGPVATLLVQNGTLRVGDVIVAGSVFGKIRAMIDDRGQKVEAATPSFAVEILGLNDVPEAGDEFDVFDNEKEARAVAEQRADVRRDTRLQQMSTSRLVTLSTLSAQAQKGELKELNLILKADVQGSVEAILNALQQLPQNEVQIRVLFSAPGEVTETDVDLAAASGAVVVGFNTTLASGARQAADREGVDIREYNIIYKLLDDIQGAMEGLLEPEEVEEALGQAEVRAVFPVGRGAVAGCYVLSGKLVRNRFLRVRRGDQIIYQGVLDSVKRMKEDAREVNAGYECGIGVSKFNDWQLGDIIEAYEMVSKRRTLSAN